MFFETLCCFVVLYIVFEGSCSAVAYSKIVTIEDKHESFNGSPIINEGLDLRSSQSK